MKIKKLYRRWQYFNPMWHSMLQWPSCPVLCDSLISTEQSLFPSITERFRSCSLAYQTNHSAADSFRYEVVQWQMLVAHVIYTFTHTHHVLQCRGWGAWKPTPVQTLETRPVILVCFTGLDRTGEVKTGTRRALLYSCHKPWFCPLGCKNNTDKKNKKQKKNGQSVFGCPCASRLPLKNKRTDPGQKHIIYQRSQL